MEIRILNAGEAEKHYDDILDMLIVADGEFVPPLSVRTSTTQADLKEKPDCGDGVQHYFEGLKRQRFVIACEAGKLLGFVSYKEDYVQGVIGEEELPNIYISTLIVKPEGRGKGLTKKMYTALFDAYAHANVFTRTWSTNAAHISILKKFGFETYKVLAKDRGEHIDTVYFKKSRIGA